MKLKAAGAYDAHDGSCWSYKVKLSLDQRWSSARIWGEVVCFLFFALWWFCLSVQKHSWTSGGNKCKDKAAVMIFRFALIISVHKSNINEWLAAFLCSVCWAGQAFLLLLTGLVLQIIGKFVIGGECFAPHPLTQRWCCKLISFGYISFRSISFHFISFQFLSPHSLSFQSLSARFLCFSFIVRSTLL